MFILEELFRDLDDVLIQSLQVGEPPQRYWKAFPSKGTRPNPKGYQPKKPSLDLEKDLAQYA